METKLKVSVVKVPTIKESMEGEKSSGFNNNMSRFVRKMNYAIVGRGSTLTLI